MAKTLAQIYGNAPAVGGVCLSNWGGLEFIEPSEADPKIWELEPFYIVCDNYGDGRRKYRRHVVHYTYSQTNPRAYINRDGRRVYLDEVMRIR